MYSVPRRVCSVLLSKNSITIMYILFTVHTFTPLLLCTSKLRSFCGIIVYHLRQDTGRPFHEVAAPATGKHTTNISGSKCLSVPGVPVPIKHKHQLCFIYIGSRPLMTFSKSKNAEEREFCKRRYAKTPKDRKDREMSAKDRENLGSFAVFSRSSPGLCGLLRSFAYF